jgi:hypothetical protein
VIAAVEQFYDPINTGMAGGDLKLRSGGNESAGSQDRQTDYSGAVGFCGNVLTAAEAGEDAANALLNDLSAIAGALQIAMAEWEDSQQQQLP